MSGRLFDLLRRERRAEASLEPMSPARLATALRERRAVEDEVFDEHLPASLRGPARHHFTPVRVGVRVGEWLDALGVRTVLDVGSGAGKLCVVAALASRARFVGVEQRPRLVAAAQQLARRLEVEGRVSFVSGALGSTPLGSFDAYYFYNPFGENLFESEDCIDHDVELGASRLDRDVVLALGVLRAAPPGTIVITYNGLGADLPARYREVLRDDELPNPLVLARAE